MYTGGNKREQIERLRQKVARLEAYYEEIKDEDDRKRIHFMSMERWKKICLRHFRRKKRELGRLERQLRSRE